MQGIALMPQNPHQGSTPPNTSLVTDVSMDISLEPNQQTKEKTINQSDSGIFSTTNNSSLDQMDLSSRTNNSENCESDNRSDCSSPGRKYFCPICDQILTSQHEFTLHIKSHNNESEFQDNEKGFICRICNKILSSSSSLDRHVLVHTGERPFNCKFCGDSFTTNGNMHRHMRTHNQKSDNYESDASTDSGGSSKIEYNNNKIEEKQSNKRKYEATIDLSCKRREYSSDSDNSTQAFRCPVCERTDFNSVLVLKNHLEDNHPEYPAKCDKCDHIFQNNKLLQNHKSAVHEGNVLKHSILGFKDLTFVDFSSEKFAHIARYECEKNLHKVTGNLRFQCKRCPRAFPSLNSLEIHEQYCIARPESANAGLDLSKTTNISENDIRRNEFFARLDLQDNSPEKAASPPPVVEVEVTPNQKLRQQLLQRAINIDTTKDLADIQSIISMTTSGSLLQQLQSKTNEIVMNHVQTPDTSESNRNQTEDEPQDMFAIEFRKMKLRGEFPCRLCTAIFPNLRALKGHNRTHLNGNNNGTYRCNMCPHSSFDKAALIRHMRTHNGDRPYECSLCNYAFTTKANCERHLRNRHAKTTREEVKKNLIYHPSEDPTNDDINKLTAKEESKKSSSISSNETIEMSPDKVLCSTPKLPDLRILPEPKPEINHVKPDIAPLIPNLQLLKTGLNLIAPKDAQSNLFPNVNDIIRAENLKTFREEHTRTLQNGTTANFIQTQFPFTPPKFPNILMPQHLPQPKIQVKNLNDLQENDNYDSQSDEEFVEQDEPMDLVLDLSKKRTEEDIKTKIKETEDQPQDLTKKSSPPVPEQKVNTIGEYFSQHLINTPPKLDPVGIYTTQLANIYRTGFPALPGWPGFPVNPLFYQSLQASAMQPDQDMKERLKLQLCGNTIMSDNLAERIKNLQQFAMRSQNLSFNGIKCEDTKPDIKPDINFSPIKPNNDHQPPLTLNMNSAFDDNMHKLRTPVGHHRQDVLQSPNSVKMVIKNGVLMPKQKQRRYRTERPFTCEHCSARFTLRSNMERHIKQQHPQYWSQRQRGALVTPGRKSQSVTIKPNFCDISIPNYEMPKLNTVDETKELINEKLKFAILAQHLRQAQAVSNQEIKREEDEESGILVIDENDEKAENKTDDDKIDDLNDSQMSHTTEERWNEYNVAVKTEGKNEETQDLVPISRLLDNASQQQFKEYFKREREEQEACAASEEDEEGLVASGSTSEGNISGTDENRSENETAPPAKKKSAYSLAPNRVTCPYCSRKFPWTSSLRRHILTHTGQKPFKCSHCPLLFTTKSNCDRHLLRKHGNAASTISNESSSSNQNSNYLMRNVPERPFKCSNCSSSTFSTYSNLKKHISCKHATNAQGDDIKAQGYEAGSSEDEKIMTTSRKSDWEHQISLQKVPSNSENQTGQQTQNSDLPFKCHLCEGSFGERQDALDHIKDKHFSEYELLMSKNAYDPNASTPDESNHHEEDENEIRGKFPDYSNRKVVCAFCMRRFWSAEDLRRHMRTHTGERPFSCDICRRRFTLKHSMLRHRKKHGSANMDNDNLNSDEDGHNVPSSTYDKYKSSKNGEKTDESDGNEGSDLISNLLGIGDRSLIDKVLTASADDAAKLLGVKNGVKE